MPLCAFSLPAVSLEDCIAQIRRERTFSLRKYIYWLGQSFTCVKIKKTAPSLSPPLVLFVRGEKEKEKERGITSRSIHYYDTHARGTLTLNFAFAFFPKHRM